MGSPTALPPRPSLRPPDAPVFFVGVADLRLSKAPNAIISTLGLGSCLGITCYDPVNKVGAMLHAMLADSLRHRAVSPIPAMYLDLGVPLLLESTTQLGGEPSVFELKVFGGAQILQTNDYFSIGRQNVEMMKQLVIHYGLNVKCWDVGGQTNRSIELHLATGRVRLRTPSRGEVWA